MRRLLLIIFMLSALSLAGYAQKEVRSQVRKGNKQFAKERYREAEIEYRKALELNPNDPETNYNLANTLYRTERGEEAGKIYQELMKEIKLMPKERAADLAHNAGNLAMKAKDYQSAIEMYKESLRRRPTDEETRYNLALAQKLLEQQQQQGGGGDDNQQQQDDQQKQQDDQQQDQQQQQQPQEQNDQQNKEQQQQTQSQRMSQDNAEKILNAYIQDEKDTQRKVEQMKQQQQQGRKSRPKNW
ncbi:tetratricopeptide repeat protein [Porphyromonas levii]|uniref:tetratricopeptide repeat protein n=1 Tax=Porphyromonas levii TaxID=28114 RepID=UPI00039DFA47|nr:tetratricopeptide repeat protein [Porphyromonas levii]